MNWDGFLTWLLLLAVIALLSATAIWQIIDIMG